MEMSAQAVQPRVEGLGCTPQWGCGVECGTGLSRCRSRDGGNGAAAVPRTTELRLGAAGATGQGFQVPCPLATCPPGRHDRPQCLM